ncbi:MULTISPECIES: RNA chaperone ProQ [unclassified Gilliamella]|uniref:RNA chaperone ProQ n=1 Tax=unclassified Gilliamella TaxID=2685620 RepID=UPI00130AE9D7|nr:MULTISPECIES: RNA chaperone ProQ [unclassified Gilliamella]MWP48617.1 RNA chaperone ProQ [Gilliamella sp. Lep-s35]MWP68679.1 RNA chaperone ProQ [Gilliamella sp. Lep-s5]MWP76653.1 RNA chaperone ProQ [Gilliamella sp. Lep-s21]
MESQFQLTNSKEIIAYLAQQFPNCFTLEGEAKPLKIGIFQDILSCLDNGEILSKTKLRAALRAYTMSWRYLYSIKEGINRVDLDGNPHEVINQEQMEYAQQQLKESKEKAKMRFKERAKGKRKTTHSPFKKSNTLKVGDFVKVIVGNKPIKVQIINIEKEHIKVKVGVGMELTVKPEHIINK